MLLILNGMDGGHYLPKDRKMFLQSSNARKSIILAAAMNVEEDYKRFRTSLENDVKLRTND
jgi:hypothetical protein